jgi:hypothetical protein
MFNFAFVFFPHRLQGCNRLTRVLLTSPHCLLTSLSAASIRTLTTVQLNLAQLTHLNLSSLSALRSLRLNAPRLVELNLASCFSLEHFSGAYPNVHTLHLFNCRSIVWAPCRAGLGELPALVNLNATGMIQMTDADVVELVRFAGHPLFNNSFNQCFKMSYPDNPNQIEPSKIFLTLT